MTRRAAAVTEAEVARAVRGVERAAPGRFVIEIDPRRGVVRAVPVGSAGLPPSIEDPAAEAQFGCGLAFVP